MVGGGKEGVRIEVQGVGGEEGEGRMKVQWRSWLVRAGQGSYKGLSPAL